MKLPLIAIIVALSACSPQAPNPANEAAAAAAAVTVVNETAPAPVQEATPIDPNALTADGWGPLRIGMTRAALVEALGDDSDPDAVGGPDPASCDQFRPARAPQGMLAMLERGVLTRISLIRDADIATDKNIRLGDPAAKVSAAYGTAITREPHTFLSPEGAYLTIWAGSGAGRHGIRYEIDAEDKVSAIHAGGPAIEYVEGCL